MITEGIVVEGHRGTWYIVDTGFHKGKKVHLLEHEYYGGDAAHVIVDENMKLLLEDVWNGLGELGWCE